MKFPKQIAAVALAAAAGMALTPNAQAHCGYRHHVARRVIARTRIVERTIVEPAVVAQPAAFSVCPQLACQQTLPAIAEPLAVPVAPAFPRWHHHHHLLGFYSPFFGLNIL